MSLVHIKLKLQKTIFIYRNIPQSVRASLWFTLMTILQKGIWFLVTPIYTRLLTTDEYGYYSVFSSWSNLLMTVATLNLAAGVFNNGMLKYENDRKRYISSMQGLSGLSVIAVFAFIFAFARPIIKWSGLNFTVLCGIFLYLLFYPCFNYWSMYQRYIYEYKMLVFLTILISVATPVLSIGLIYILPDRKYGVVAGTVIVQMCIGIIFFIKNLIEGKSLYVAEYWKYAVRFNVPLLPHYLAGMVLGQSDRIMIKSMVGQDKAGIYSLAYSISLMLGIVLNGINASFVPWTYQRLKEGDYERLRKIANYILLLLGAVVLGGVLIAPEVIRIMGTEEYLEAKWIIAPVMLGTFYTMLYTLFANLEFYYEKTTFIMFASVTVAILNIVLNYICIPLFGYIAAGYTTMVCYLVFALMHYVFMRRLCKNKGIPNPYDTVFIFWFILGLSFAALLMMATYNFWFLRVALIILILLVCVVQKDKVWILLKGIREK